LFTVLTWRCDPGFKFFLNREVPVGWMQLLILSFGGSVGWEGQGSPFTESDKTITHQIVDRPEVVSSPYDSCGGALPEVSLD
jgi:pescadillo protein